MKRALGLTEISGLSIATVAVDTMTKAVNIRILEIENTKNLGYMIIKIVEDVGVVNAAINAGKQIGVANNRLVSQKVIPGPSDYVEQASRCPEPPVPPFPPMKEMQEETGTGKTRETVRESPETAGEPGSDGGQAGSVREETDSRDKPQVEAEQPSKEEDFKLTEKPKEASRRTSVVKGTGTARFRNS